MVRFTAILEKFKDKGEKTGWTYIEVPAKIAHKIKPDTKVAYRIKGKLDDYEFNGASLVPMGGGDFILAVNAAMRTRIRKVKGDTVKVQLEEDKDFSIKPPAELLECLKDEPEATEFFFKKLPGSHRNYYINWINSAKTEPTRTKRIAQTINALVKGFHYGQMMRALKKD
ncbi:MAG: hypothetical protein JWN76_1131 [Chitinophagaceae bacterium]|nr:hypothetical protein [Chitinophagaceae bacterium]